MSDSDTPALAAYNEVSVLRDRLVDVIWGGKEASPGELRAILADLDAGVAKLATPLNTDLAEGNIYLRFRRVNFLIDKVIVLDRLQDPHGAISAWQEIAQIAWMDLARSGPQAATFQRLLHLPEAAAIRAQLAAAARWTQAPALLSPYRERLGVEERVAGLSLIWTTAREGFVWFDHVPDLDWDRAYLEAIPRVIDAKETAAYYRELMRFAALLRDGHCNVYPPQELQGDFYSSPGVRTAKVEGEVLVLDVLDESLQAQGLHVGAQILSIDGIDVERYAQEQVAPYQSSSTRQDHEVRTYSYALLAGASGLPVQLGVRDADGRKLLLSARRSGYPAAPRPPQQDFAISEDGIAVVRVSQLESAAGAKLLGKHIDEVIGSRGLILDLRGNGGGSSDSGLQLLRWLTDAPLPSMVSTYRESNALERARQGAHALYQWRRVAGGDFHSPYERPFRGPVAMLIDARTFSAAEDTAAVFRLMRRGLIVGTPSGGSTGQPWVLGLPGGGRARICVKRDSYPDGSTFVGTGIIPDIEVPLTVRDVRAGRDAALEHAAHALVTPG
jgi:C-terminal processing protease CtpA/Prc